MNIEDRIVKNLLQLGAFLYRTGNRMTEAYGLNQQQFIILNEIVSRQNVSQKQIVAELLLEKSNVSKIIKKLREAELVTVDASPDDRRTAVLSPTLKGKEVCSDCLNTVCRWNREWLSSCSYKKKQQFLDVLKDAKTLLR